MYVGIGTRVRLVFFVRTIFVTIALPCQRNATAGSATEVIVGTNTLSAIGWFVRTELKKKQMIRHNNELVLVNCIYPS